jgi:hypothetical protein
MHSMTLERTTIDRPAGEAMAENPAAYFGNSVTEMQTVAWRDLSRLHLEAAKMRFATLRDRVPILKKLSDGAGITDIDRIEDLVPLLFDHSVYKSYPASLLNDCRFDALTRWLDKLTTYDLSKFDASGLESLDEWLEKLDAETPLMVCHSSGTTGTMSFLPMGLDEWGAFTDTYWPGHFQRFGDPANEPDPDGVHVVSPYFRAGRSSHLRINEFLVTSIARSEEKFHAAIPARMSSDVLYLAGRLRAAAAKGESEKLILSPSLLKRKAEFEALQKSMPARMEAFMQEVMETLGGKKVLIQGTWNIHLGFADKGLARGLSNFFAPDSVLISGGGGKGMVMPEDWKERVLRFTGAHDMNMVYGMSEAPGSNRLCKHGHYHMAPWIVPFVLHPHTGEPLAREGVVTGRAAFFDLIARRHWGGFITGDEVTMHWDCNCPCGRTSPYLDNNIERYSEKNGGDDKITCAATAEAHQEALDYLVEFEI